ncbi:MAG: RNA-binding S4 domain-containing protein [Gammaproteobacteria bacterium]|nr:RNA-binding S4 domain-containing protein [Gammaproteobacteria bacterium]
MEIFELNKYEFIELNNLLKVTGLCESGGVAKMLIADGQVMVDDQIELRKRCKIRSGQVVTFNDHQVKVK